MRFPQIPTPRPASWLAIAIIGALFGCAEGKGPRYPKPLAYERPPQTDSASMVEPRAADSQFTTRDGPMTPAGRIFAEPYASTPPPKLTGESISVTFDGIPLPTFINSVFNELLKVTFEIEDSVAKREQLVTLRTAEPITPAAFYELVINVLQNYGISVVYQNNVYRVIESANRREDLPRIVALRGGRNVPNDMRPVFQFVLLKNVGQQEVLFWLNMALKDRIKVQPMGVVNGVIITGQRDDVAAALQSLDVLDQPYMAGLKSRRIEPVYWSAEKLSDQLSTILQAEGYSIGIGMQGTPAIRMIPVPALNTIIVFTPNEATLEHIEEWARELDQPSQTINREGVFYYQVENLSAASLAGILGGVNSSMDTAGQPTPNLTQPTSGGVTVAGGGIGGPASGNQTATTPATAGGGTFSAGGKFLVDAAHNAIIFQGTAEQFSQFRSLAQQMDRAPLEVLIEATIAEVTLNEGESLNVALAFDDALQPVQNSSAVRSDGSLVVNLVRDSGSILSKLSANSNKNRVSILSSPRIVASNGKAAFINVGTQVPIITTQQSSPTGTVGGTSTLLQDVQYRSTGVSLTVTPSINSSRRVELEISQEVSEAQANRVSTVQSPAIFTRSIATQLSLSDGETVLLGGLISENYSDGDSGIPYLKDIPVLGNLFKNQSSGRTRIELVVLMTPYIIDSPETARLVRDAFKKELGQLSDLEFGRPQSPVAEPANTNMSPPGSQ